MISAKRHVSFKTREHGKQPKPQNISVALLAGEEAVRYSWRPCVRGAVTACAGYGEMQVDSSAGSTGAPSVVRGLGRLQPAPWRAHPRSPRSPPSAAKESQAVSVTLRSPAT